MLFRNLVFLLAVFLAFTTQAQDLSCYEAFIALQKQRSIYGAKHIFRAKGAPFNNAYAIEKEGLFYADIEPLFNVLKKETKKDLRKYFKDEQSGKDKPIFTNWLANYATHWRKPGVAKTPTELKGKTPSQILHYLLSHENPLELISIAGIQELIDNNLLNFNDFDRSKNSPEWIKMHDDIGSYELVSNGGVADRDKLQEQIEFTEEYFDGDHIGHQHLVHGWSKDANFRKETAGQYIEMIDASTWYQFWRSMSRHPEDAVIMDHPYLGVHNRKALDRLATAYETNNPKLFNNKFRSLGARNFPGDPKMKGQSKDMRVVSLETRGSINKNDLKRGFFHDQLEARIVSGDYNGLRDYRSYEFDASTPLEQLVSKHLSEEDVAKLKEFEELFPMLNYNSHGRAYNHYRNKIVAPLLQWGNRLNIQAKMPVIERAQKRYAEKLVEIGEQYKKDLKKANHGVAIGEARADALEKIKYAAWDFAKKAQLDADFENYLTPVPKHEDLPDIRFAPDVVRNPKEGQNGYRVDVNKIDTGVEYSFRFNNKPRSKKQADEQLKKSAEALRDSLGGGTVEKYNDGGHGHGLSVRYIVKDNQGRKWRVEWDGIARSYNKGSKGWEPSRARSGHTEIPSPKGAPQDTADIEALYSSMRGLGQYAKRSAGGAHMNFDLKPLRRLGPKTGARMAANFINVFESNREMISFLFQHPYRERVATPYETKPEFHDALDGFEGDWNDLGKLIYENRYFNEYKSRKPVYMQLNMAALLKDIVPKAYRKSIDIKKPGAKWFPSFDKDGDKGEMRLMDAMPDEYTATLQMKYTRALFNKAFNGERAVKFEKKYDENSKRDWKEDEDLFIKEARAHFRDLGLDFNEFLPLVLQARRIQGAEPSKKALLDKGDIKTGRDPVTGNKVVPKTPKTPKWSDWNY